MSVHSFLTLCQISFFCFRLFATLTLRMHMVKVVQNGQPALNYMTVIAMMLPSTASIAIMRFFFFFAEKIYSKKILIPPLSDYCLHYFFFFFCKNKARVRIRV